MLEALGLNSDTYRLAVCCIHACLDLRMDPQCGTLPHSTQQECFKVKEHLIRALPVASWLVWDD
jgi:hypothetical protein